MNPWICVTIALYALGGGLAYAALKLFEEGKQERDPEYQMPSLGLWYAVLCWPHFAIHMLWPERGAR